MARVSNKVNQVYTLISYINIHFNILPPFKPNSLLLPGFPPKFFFITRFLSPMRAACSAYLSLGLVIAVTSDEGYNL